MKSIFYLFFLLLFAGCKRGNRQEILLRNLSSEDIYFLLSKNQLLTDPNDITNIRPKVVWKLDDVKMDQKEAKSTKLSLYRNLIQRDSLEVILTSGSMAIFVDGVTIQSIIKDRFGGQMNIFIITQNHLGDYSDQEIIDQKLYKFVKTLSVEDIKSDMLVLEYQ